MTGEPLSAEKARRREAAAAERFVERPEFERFLRWRDHDDPRFDALSPNLKTMLGYYSEERNAAKGDRR